MGKVVDIEASRPRRRRGRKRPSKTALVLGGGGMTGGVYEIGALRALDLLAVNSTVNDFDVYVGTSAGSFVASMLANGVTPDEMMQVINERVPSDLDDLDLEQGAEAELPRLHREGGRAAGALAGAGPQPSSNGGLLGDRHRRRPRRGAPVGRSTPATASPTTSRGSSATAGAATTSACSTRSSTSPRPTSIPASGSSSARRAGPTSRSRRRSRARPRSRSSTNRSS